MRAEARSGIALVASLLAISVTVVLLTAFLSSQRGLISLSSYSREKLLCRSTAESLAEVCRFEIERKKSWALVAGDATDRIEYKDASDGVGIYLEPVDPSHVRSIPELSELNGSSYFRGKDEKRGVEFFVAAVNNLQEKEATASGVGPHSFRLQFRTDLGKFSERTNVVYRRAAFFDSTVLAAKDISIVANAINFSSLDPYRNQIRSEENIRLPEYGQLEFTPAVDSLIARKGTVWAKDKIFIDNDPTESKLKAAAAATKGEFLPEAPSRFSIPNLEKDDIDFDEGYDITEIDPGEYRFGSVTATVKLANGAKFTIGAPALTVNDSPPSYYLDQDSIVPPEDLDIGKDHDDFDPTADIVSIEISPSDAVAGSASQSFGGISFDLKQRKALIYTESQHSKNYCSGDLKITGGALEFITPPPPSPDVEPVRAYLSVNGDFYMDGALINCGKLVASHDVVLAPSDLKIDQVETAKSVAVYAGNDISIVPPYSNDSEFVSASNRFFVFKGLVFAKRNFNFSSSVGYGRGKITYDRKLYVEGSLIAKTGKVTVAGSESVELKYNRNFLDDIIQNPERRDLVKLEEVSWRTF